MFIRRWAHRSFDFFLSAWLLFTDFDLVRRFSGLFGAVEIWLTTGLGVSFPFRGRSLLPLRWRRGLGCFLATDSTVGVYLTLYGAGVSSKFSSGIVRISVVDIKSCSMLFGLLISENICIWFSSTMPKLGWGRKAYSG